MSGEDRFIFNPSFGSDMDAKDLIQIGLFVINLLILGLAAVLWSNLQEAKKEGRDAAESAKKASDDQKEHELYCARTYVTQEGLTQAIQNLEKTIGSLVDAVKSNMDETRQNFRDVFSKLNQKQDKP